VRMWLCRHFRFSGIKLSVIAYFTYLLSRACSDSFGKTIISPLSCFVGSSLRWVALQCCDQNQSNWTKCYQRLKTGSLVDLTEYRWWFFHMFKRACWLLARRFAWLVHFLSIIPLFPLMVSQTRDAYFLNYVW